MSRCNLQLNQHLQQEMAHRCQQLDTRILSWGLASPALRALLSLNINTIDECRTKLVTNQGVHSVET